jgi:predicted TIM-barrel fold metal-dependent hydrolase
MNDSTTPMSPPVLGVRHTLPQFKVPAGTCVCHVHIFGPHDKYPLAEDRVYMPSSASVSDLVALHEALVVDRAVIVQASPQGTDNRRLIDALDELRAMGREARGVAVIDAATSEARLDDMHRAGVRGVRVNLQSTGQSDAANAKRQLQEAANRVASRGWHEQIYTGIPMIESLYETIMDPAGASGRRPLRHCARSGSARAARFSIAARYGQGRKCLCEAFWRGANIGASAQD